MKWGNTTQFNIPRIAAYQYSWKASQTHLTLKKKQKLKELSGSSSSTLFRRLLYAFIYWTPVGFFVTARKTAAEKRPCQRQIGETAASDPFYRFPKLCRDDKKPGGLNFSPNLLQHCDYRVSSLSKTASFFAIYTL